MRWRENKIAGERKNSKTTKLAISAFGYVAGAEQSAATQAGINLTVNLIPAILLIAAAVGLVVLWDKTDKDFDEIRTRAKERRNAMKHEGA